MFIRCKKTLSIILTLIMMLTFFQVGDENISYADDDGDVGGVIGGDNLVITITDDYSITGLSQEMQILYQ